MTYDEMMSLTEEQLEAQVCVLSCVYFYLCEEFHRREITLTLT